MDERQVQLIIQEKNLAIEQYNQSKLLIEKLEQEVQTLKDFQPTSNKNIVKILQKEYSEVINALRAKLSSVQDKYKEEVCNNSKREREVIILTKRIDELNSKLKQIENEYFICNGLLKQEREKYLTLEKDFIRLQNESFSLEKKYSCVRILENEQNELMNENRKLSNDCNEMETALEICHQKMRGYEEELNLYCKCLKQMEQDKNVIENNERIGKELNSQLIEKIEEMNSSLKKLQNEEEFFHKNIEYLVENFSMDNQLNDDCFNKNFKDDDGCLGFIKLKVLLSNCKKEYQNCIRKKQDLEIKLAKSLTNMEKYRGYIKEANNMITNLKKKLNEQEEIIKNSNSKKDVEKYVQKIGNTNAELQKQIHSQEELHKKWKREVTELINRFKNRISFLNANYKKSQRENFKLKKCLNKYLQQDKHQNDCND